MRVAGREINRWQFGCVHLWDIEAPAALERGLPGWAALVPLMKDAKLSHIEQAARQIETAAPAKDQNDLLAILHAFGQHRYTVEQLNRIIGRERIMESWIYQEGRAEGQLAEARELCRKAVRKWRPRAGTKVWTAIDRCTNLTALEEVTLNVPEWDTRDILRRLTAVRGKNNH